MRLLTEEGALIGVGSWKSGKLVPEKIFVGPPPSAATLTRSLAEVAGSGVSAAGKTTEPRLRIVDPQNRMAVVQGVDALTPDLGRLYLAVGVFDGLHRGHLYLLRELCRAARRAGARPAVITFDAHPEELIEGLAPPLLCDPDERLVRLQAAGVEVTVVQHFDHALRTTPYDGFVAAIRERVVVAGFVMTPDAAFGFERGGTPETLAALGENEGFAVTVVASFQSNGQQVRSSEIRSRISAGDLAGARSLLGRDHGFSGRVGPAESPGVVPLAFDLPVSLPPDGRYAAIVGPEWMLGRRPVPASFAAVATVADGRVTLELSDGFAEQVEVRVVLLRTDPDPDPDTDSDSAVRTGK
jgi:riboflavin kinase/FMN adenylyltransferase